ncbi:MAG TPA: hypothetical protein VIA06_03520 [Candidatus Dormibacteraeota bacterium]|nr:hypothetical protein [Candidatus Dormibacteraeota bacterium]
MRLWIRLLPRIGVSIPLRLARHAGRVPLRSRHIGCGSLVMAFLVLAGVVWVVENAAWIFAVIAGLVLAVIVAETFVQARKARASQ